MLHRRDFGNTSLIVEVFAVGHGRLPALAKGARRGRGAVAAILQPFRPLWMSWSGRGEVRTLTRSEPAGRAFDLQGEALLCGFYLNELLVRLLGRADPHADLFAFYHAALSDLAAGRDLQAQQSHRLGLELLFGDDALVPEAGQLLELVEVGNL